MPLEPGRQLLHYRLVERIGAGGMGEVWKARDLNLDRDVALKCLPDEFARDPERQARFEREAKLLASFNHPNIAGIFGYHEIDGLRFLAMELVRGQDLGELLERGALPLSVALPFALQITEGLEFAHEQGIIHRDLKPANLRWTVDQKAKVLDFGLAKALGTEVEPQDPRFSPTITAGQTREGVILGTAAYMSPEQARGAPVDRRADIWAFGCVLFEMLSGQRAFPGDTVTDTFVSILSREPDWAALPQDTPSSLAHLLRRCLTKDPRQRLRDIGEARIALERILAEEPVAAEAASGETARPKAMRIVWSVALGLLLFGAGYLLRPVNEPVVGEEVDPDLRLRRLTFSGGLAQEPALSPDGNYVAYTTDLSGNLDIAVLPLSGGDVNRVVSHPADDAQPRWSPDGSRLAFVSARDQDGLLTVVGGLGALSTSVSGNGGDIFLMPAMGGAPTKLIDRGFYPSWSPDGSSLVFQSNRDGMWDIWRIPANGGDPSKLTDDEEIDYQPAWSPDGSWIVFGAQDPPRLCAVSATGGPKITLYEGRALDPAWSQDCRWIYFSADRASAPGDMDLWRIPFRPESGSRLRAQRITMGDGSELGASLSADGDRLVFGEVAVAPDIWRLDVSNGTVEQITTGASSEDYPHLAPDGRRLIFMSDRAGAERLWSLDLIDRTLLQMETSHYANDPRWSPNGQTVAYRQIGEAQAQLAVQRWGDAKAQIVAIEQGEAGAQWSPDGNRLAGYGDGIWVHTVGGTSTRVVEGSDSSFPTWSPDGQQIAYQREVRSGVREIWAVSAAGGEPRLVAGGDVEYSHPQWCPIDQDRILVVVDHRDLAIIHISSSEVEQITELASSTVVVDYPSWSFDGQSIYFSLSRKAGDIYVIEGL